jgi:60 kDa SS-A/Ro ribonucleoprotein
MSQDAPLQLLTALELDIAAWVAIERRATWRQTRMNLNTFARHGMFKVEGMAELLAARLRDEAAIRRAHVFPYQLLMAWKVADAGIPEVVREALHEAMEIATRNVPELPGKEYVFPDVSRSMQSAVTGHRRGATSGVRCVDVAALIAAAVLRRNPAAEVIPFEHQVCPVELDPALGIIANAERLAAVGGGTNCSAPLALLNQRRAEGDLLIYVSDYEPWVDRANG